MAHSRWPTLYDLKMGMEIECVADICKGSFFRSRYIGNGLKSEFPIIGLSQNSYNELPIEIESIDEQYATASVMAFFQAFYPPHLLDPEVDVLVGDFIMANGTTDNYPMNGYQYPMIETRSEYDPDSIWLAGYDNCATALEVQNTYYTSPEANNTMVDTLPYYQSVGYDFLQDRAISDYWNYDSAWSIFDTLDYLNRHNKSVAQAFAPNGSLDGLLPFFGSLAASKQWTLYGDLDIYSKTSGDQILAVGGKTLAAKILALLADNVTSAGILQKFSLLVGEYQEMIALLSLLGLGSYNGGEFHMLPPYGSAIVFELFSYDSPANASILPDPNNLFVRFLFRNGSDPSSGDAELVMPPLYAYPIFNRGPSGTDIPWNDFIAAMSNIALNNVEDYCTLCQAPTLYCAVWLGDDSPSNKKTVSPPVAGVIGAIVTLAIIGALVAAAMYFLGVRFHRQPRERSQLGGFKGSAKLASDADLNIPKNAAPLGIGAAVVDSESKRGHERVGSWELKTPKEEENEERGHRRFVSLGSTVVGRPSFEGDEEMEVIHSTPTSPRETL
jgi:histidine phosphatase superfamily protein (branch 2)